VEKFTNNLKNIKREATNEARNFVKKNQKDFKDVEVGIKSLFENNEAGVFLEEKINSLKELKGEKKYLLYKGEIE